MELRYVFPSGYYELLLVFPGSDRLLNAQSHIELSFMGLPDQLKALRYTPNEIEWKNGKTFSADQLHAMSRSLPTVRSVSIWFTLGSRNNAPTDQDPRHHEYYVNVYPMNKLKPFTLGESIGGGFAERGGDTRLSMEELLAWPHDWKEHFRKSGCSWAIGFVEEYQNDTRTLMKQLADYIFERQWAQASKDSHIK